MASQRILAFVRETDGGPEATRGELVIVPVFRLSSTGRMWAIAMAWARSRGRVAREREDRLTTESVMRNMPPGGVWLDCDGDRFRIIVQPATSELSAPSSGLEQVEALLRLGQHGHAPREGTNGPAALR